jgi:hypothetical protein
MPRPCVLLAASTAALVGCEDYVAPGDYGTDASESVATAEAGTEPAASVAPTSGDASLNGTTSGSSPVTDGASAATLRSERPSGPCDLTGRWLVVIRMVTDALGTMSASHEWFYDELTQSGTQVSVSKGLHCGKDFRGLSAVSGNADFHKVWPAMMAKSSDTGRKGVSDATSSGCQVSLEKRYEVIAVTVPYYLDPSHPLPPASQQAAGGTPGWEDWDQDGQPGYTLTVSGLATGQLYMADRTWTMMSGTIAASASSFDLAVDWGDEQDVLGLNGPAILMETATATKDSDASQHFATFVRLTDTQATGDDTSVCSAIRSLAPSAAPKASN